MDKLTPHSPMPNYAPTMREIYKCVCVFELHPDKTSNSIFLTPLTALHTLTTVLIRGIQFIHLFNQAELFCNMKKRERTS